MSLEPKITTIIPTYKRPVLLKRAVLSVLNQSYARLTVQIFDNASGDETEGVARELMRRDSRVHYYRHQENIGSLNNVIYGIERVPTEYFSILCDDDLLMPDFYDHGLRIHEQDAQLAFVAMQVVTVDESGHFAAPWSHPDGDRRLAPPEGVVSCLKSGASLPGVIYRTSAIKSIGVPRVAWWNWTESGWNALAALNFAIEFSSRVGAIGYLHASSNSRQMGSTEFRLSWFRMLAEFRRTSLKHGVGSAFWRRHLMARQYTMFLSTCLRLSRESGGVGYEELRQLAISSGVNSFVAASGIKLSEQIQRVGAGGMINDVLDRGLVLGKALARTVGRRHGRENDDILRSASHVLFDLNRQAGLN